jgi:hypothetical protein
VQVHWLFGSQWTFFLSFTQSARRAGSFFLSDSSLCLGRRLGSGAGTASRLGTTTRRARQTRVVRIGNLLEGVG